MLSVHVLRQSEGYHYRRCTYAASESVFTDQALWKTEGLTPMTTLQSENRFVRADIPNSGNSLVIRTARTLGESKPRPVPAVLDNVETIDFNRFPSKYINPEVITGEALTFQLPRNPSNSMTKMASALSSKIDVFGDVRFNLLGTFGGYIARIPSRLGNSPALDAATDALIAAHTFYCVKSPNNRFQCLKKGSLALRAVRDELNDPIKARSSELLCAIMVLMIVQVSLHT